MKKIFFLILVVLLAACSQPEQRSALPTPAPAPARMLIPLYVYPGANGTAWQPVVDANVYGNIDAIANPANGPGLNRNTNYVSGINKLRAGGVGVYGYVHSSYGARSIAAVKADVDTWVGWYSPLVGIFVDEAEYRAGQGDEGYYAELYDYINSKGLKVVNNPGTGTIETYINFADTTCIFESAVIKTFNFPAWGFNYPPSKFCYLAHSASAEQMRATVAMAKNNIGYVYVTNVKSGDYWASIPPYLAEEAALLAGGVVVPPTTPQTPATATATSTPTAQPDTRTATPTRTPTPLVVPTVCETAISDRFWFMGCTK